MKRKLKPLTEETQRELNVSILEGWAKRERAERFKETLLVLKIGALVTAGLTALAATKYCITQYVQSYQKGYADKGPQITQVINSDIYRESTK